MAQGAVGFMEGSGPDGTRRGLAAFGLGSDAGWGLDWQMVGQVSQADGPA